MTPERRRGRDARTALPALLALLAMTAAGPARAADIVVDTDQAATVPSNLAGDSVTVLEGVTIAPPAGALGINSSGGMTTVDNRGTIVTTGDGAHAVAASGGANAIRNGGTVTTDGVDAVGLRASGGMNAVVNDGTVTTAGTEAHGIRASGGTNTVANTGTIAVGGTDAIAILASGGTNTISNIGALTATGTGGFAIAATGGNNVIVSTGTVSVDGSDGVGIFASGGGGSISIGGTVTSAQSDAIRFGGSGNVLNLMPGARIGGGIDYGAGTTLNLGLGPGRSTVLFATGTLDGVNASSGGPVAVSGNTVAVLDRTGIAASDAVTGTVPARVHDLLGRRPARGDGAVRIGLAAPGPGLTAGGAAARSTVLWAGGFGGLARRDAEADLLDYRHDYGGGAIGLEHAVTETLTVGIVAGGAHGRIETSPDSHEIDSDTGFVGLYGEAVWGRAYLTVSLIGGLEGHDSARRVLSNLTGSESARADYDSAFVSPSLTLGARFEVADWLALRPSGRLSYTASWIDDYSESGSSANLSVASRTVRALRGQAELAAVHDLADGRGAVELRLGYRVRATDADDVDATLLATPLSFGPGGDDLVQGGYVGAGITYALAERLRLVLDLEAGLAEGDELAAAAELGLAYRF